jgi:hypothetical protein
MPSSAMLRHVALLRTDVSEERIAFIMRVTRNGELGTTLAVTRKSCSECVYCGHVQDGPSISDRVSDAAGAHGSATMYDVMLHNMGVYWSGQMQNVIRSLHYTVRICISQ